MELKQVSIKALPTTTIAHLTNVGPFQGNSELFVRLFGKIHAWARERDLMTSDTVSIAVYPDDPGTIDPQKLRLYIGVNVPADTTVDGEVSKLDLPAGQYAVASFELLPQEFPKAWMWLFNWIPENGHQTDDSRLGFEVYPFEDGKDGRLIADICVPVKPL